MANEQQVKDRDAHNREKIAETIHKNSKLFFGLIILVAAGWGGAWGYGAYETKLDREASLEFYRVENKINNIQDDLLKTLQEENKDTKTLPMLKKDPESFDKNYRILAEELESLIQQHVGKRSSLVSSLYLAELYTEHGLDDRALKLLNSVDTSSVGDAVVVGLVRTRLAGLQSSSGDCASAVSTYEDLESKASYEFMLPQLLLRKVACLIEMDKGTEAQAELDRLKAEFESTEAGRMARIYERILHYNKRDQ